MYNATQRKTVPRYGKKALLAASNVIFPLDLAEDPIFALCQTPFLALADFAASDLLFFLLSPSETPFRPSLDTSPETPEHIHIVTPACPYRTGTRAARNWRLYRDGMTTTIYRELGGSTTQLRHDINAGHVVVG